MTFLPRDQRGVGLMEIIVATVIAVIAVVALAYAFGTGRGLVDRYAAARLSLGAAQRRMELLSALPPDSPELSVGVHGPLEVRLEGQALARETWRVVPYDDDADTAPGTDLKLVTVMVAWGSGAADSLNLHRLFPLD